MMRKSELEARIKALSPLSGNAPRFSWEYRQGKIREMILGGKSDLFMEWPTSRESLHTGDTDYIQKELEELEASGNPRRWAKAIKVPPFGGAERIAYGATGTSIQQAYALMLWESYAGLKAQELWARFATPWIHEIGAGYGAMAYVCARMEFQGFYTIYDLPELQLLQQYYLSSVGVDDVIHSSADVGTFLPARDIDLLIALFSISEIRPADRRIPNAKSYLIGYQPDWGGWDNRAYFESFTSGKPELDWYDFPNPYYVNHRYLIGV